MSASAAVAVPAPRTLQPPAPASHAGRSRRDALSSFELVGTGIDGSKAFAIVKTRNDGVVTIREGGLIGGYTVRRIQPDRVQLKAPDDRETTLVIGASGGDDEASAAHSDTMTPQASATTTSARINTDQSIPEHVVYGPTASWPAGEKHVH